jgi:hypothetical protein
MERKTGEGRPCPTTQFTEVVIQSGPFQSHMAGEEMTKGVSADHINWKGLMRKFSQPKL